MIRLSQLEEDILDVLWRLQRAFPKVIVAHLDPPVPPYNTVLSTIRKLEKLGYIGFKKYGKTHEYYPILKKEEYGKSLFKKLYHDILNGSAESMVSYFTKGNKRELDKLSEIIEQMKKDQDANG